MPGIADVPPVLRQTLSERIAAFQRRELDLADSIRRMYADVFRTYRDDLEEYFLRHFYIQLGAEPPAWDLQIAQQLDTVPELTEQFNDLIDATEDEAEDTLDEDLTDGYDDGYLYGLWDLYVSGVDVDDAAYDGGSDLAKAALLAAAIGGIGYPARVTQWGAIAKQQFGKNLLTGVVSGQTLTDTLAAFDRVASKHTRNIEGLGENELHRAYLLGADLAYSQYREETDGEMWVTRNDNLVCALCREKDLTVTTDQPIADSHPHCRCQKIPVVLNAQGRPVDFVAFLSQIGRR